MDDDELTRARRALRAADPELDLARAYAESRARAEAPTRDDWADHRADDWAGDWAGAGTVEVLLRDPDTRPGRVPAAVRRASSRRRGPVLAWTAAAAAAAAVLALSLAGAPGPDALPGSAPGPSTPAAGAPHPGVSPSPSPTTWLTPGKVVTLAGKAMTGAGCGVKLRSTLGDDSIMRFYRVDEPDVAVPKPLLDQQPLPVLQAATARVVLDVPGYDGTNQRLDQDLAVENLAVEERAGRTVARIRITPSDSQVHGGDVTRVELLLDTVTWLPASAEIWAESEGGKQIQVRSELSWSGCAEPSEAPTYESVRP
ncbi:hypothetical protein [Promicromonospora sp. NPDC019610]|uniref:hypothetical protein n=1 Tax=Promicromonospora sp. NPDC019610 TaxID=3364405 RepID=UPI0037AFE612